MIQSTTVHPLNVILCIYTPKRKLLALYELTWNDLQSILLSQKKQSTKIPIVCYFYVRKGKIQYLCIWTFVQKRYTETVNEEVVRLVTQKG